jgi:hypothetical protein
LFKKLIFIIKNHFLSPILHDIEHQKLMLGKILTNQVVNISNFDLKNFEFSVFSQFGDDGIIQWLINHLDIPNHTFIEFGVEDYKESNTRFLMMNNNWSGLVIDGNSKNIERLKSQYYYWKYDLNAQSIFITRDNINSLIEEQNFANDVGLLHIDLDGNDYYIWKAITTINPIIVIIEYNSLFGINRPISIVYDDEFVRNKAHISNLLWGASLLSLHHLAIQKGYSFIGCNSAGNNAYFIRNDKLNDNFKAVSLAEGFVDSKYRESRDSNGNLTYLSKFQAKKILSGSIVFNTELNIDEFF